MRLLRQGAAEATESSVKALYDPGMAEEKRTLDYANPRRNDRDGKRTFYGLAVLSGIVIVGLATLLVYLAVYITQFIIGLTDSHRVR